MTDGTSRLALVAIADDDPDDLLLLKEAFRECRNNVRVEAFVHGAGLVDYLLRRGRYAGSDEPLPDLVLLDLYMPEGDGFEVIQAIRAEPALSHIPLLVFTGSVIDADIKRCYALGASAVIVKPSSYGDLLGLVETVCRYWSRMARL